MSNDIRLQVDTTEFRRMVGYFTQKDWLTVKRRALSKAANSIKKDAKKLFKQRLPKATSKNKKYSDRLIDAIRSSKIKETSPGELSVNVHTLGTRRPGSMTYIARFFEGGTEERFKKQYVDKKGRRYTHTQSVGRIKPLGFFRDALQNSKVHQTNMMKELEDQIVKLNNKKY